MSGVFYVVESLLHAVVRVDLSAKEDNQFTYVPTFTFLVRELVATVLCTLSIGHSHFSPVQCRRGQARKSWSGGRISWYQQTLQTYLGGAVRRWKAAHYNR